jgi:excisionase family DNA binding protein
MNTLKTWLTTKEAAEYLGTTVRWMKANIHLQGIPHRRLGNQYRFKIDDLEKFMEGNR